LLPPPPPRAPLFPYTTLFRSLAPLVVDVVLALDFEPAGLEDAGHDVPHHGAARVAEEERSGRVRAHELDLDRGVLSKGRSSPLRDRKSTRLNSSHSQISYAVF